MASTDTTTKCRRCHRPLRDAKSIAAGYGPTCIRRVRADTADFTPEQTAKAVRLIQDSSVTRIRGGVDALYQITRGHVTYWTSATDCTCTGAQTTGGCYHIEAVRLSTRRYATAA